MKKTTCVILILIMVIFLTSPLSGEARGGHWGGHGGWWVPWAIIGGAAVLAPYYYSPYYAPYYGPYYDPYYGPPPVVVQEPPPVHVPAPPPPAPPSAERIFVYPRKGQSEELQAKDRYDCHSWAVGQTHYDPIQPPGGLPEARLNQMRTDYSRAEEACLDARGYTVR